MSSELILVVEDEEILRELAVSILETAGFKVESAAMAEEAVEIWERRSSEIKLLVADIRMPGVTGIELARRFREVASDLPILFVTGSDMEHAAEISALGGVAAILPKPYLPKRLAESVRRMLGG